MSATAESLPFFKSPKQDGENLNSSVKCENLDQLVEELNEYLKNLDLSQVLVLFDFDRTIADRRDPIMSDSNAMARKAFLEPLKELEKELKCRLVDLIYEQSPYDLIEPAMPKVITSLRERGATVLGFTSRRTGKATLDAKQTVEDDLCGSLIKLNIQFSDIPSQEFDIPEGSVEMENPHLLPFEAPGKPKIVGNDRSATTVFTANYPKGLILKLLMQYLTSLNVLENNNSDTSEDKKKITTVIMIDDNDKYLKNMQLACNEMGLAFLGLHYTFADTHKPVINEAIVAVQRNCLINERQWISEEEAQERIDACKLPGIGAP